MLSLVTYSLSPHNGQPGETSVPVVVAALMLAVLTTGCLVDFAGPDPDTQQDAALPDAANPDAALPGCGDGVLQAAEECDDSNLAPDDGCSPSCTVEPGWDCDFTTDPAPGCEPICGDGQVVGNEPCDDGNTSPNDGCSDSCQVEPFRACHGSPSQCICVVYVNREPVIAARSGASWDAAFDNVADALLTAEVHRPCEIWVAEGTYFVYQTAASDQLTLLDDSRLYGGFAGHETARVQRDPVANPTVISAEQEGNPITRVRTIFLADAVTGVVIDGVTIRRADSTTERGGGMKLLNSSSVQLNNVVFSDNVAARGGAIHLQDDSTLELTDATFLSNSAHEVGGAIRAFESTLVSAQGCLFEGNSADDNGGAMDALNTPVDVSHSRFRSNQTPLHGGALRFAGVTLQIINSVFWDNSADDGAALSVWLNGASATITNCTFHENTLISGHGAVLEVGAATVHFINSILWGSTTDLIHDMGTGVVDYDHCDVTGGATGPGNIDASPGFVDAAGGDLRLSQGSPCIDAGNGDPAPSTDLHGNPRVDDTDTVNTGAGTPPYVDLGAYEYQP